MAITDALIATDPTAGVRVSVRASRAMMIATPAQAKAIQAAIAEPYKLLTESMLASGARLGEPMDSDPEDSRVGGDAVVAADAAALTGPA